MPNTKAKKTPATRAHYLWFSPITTRWMDNDIYGHINNVTYYAYFDSAVNKYLITQGGLDIHHGDVIAYVVHSGCDYHAPIAYPDEIEVGIRVAKLGNSSVTYQVAIFKTDAQTACAEGEFVHVFVRRDQNCAVPIPPHIRQALTLIM